MVEGAQIWRFSRTFPQIRRTQLENASSFDDIVERVHSEIGVTFFNTCRGREGLLKNCVRPEFQFVVDCKTFNLFFNSPVGYRAQYLLDPNEGQKQNCQLIGQLLEKLVAHANGNIPRHPIREDQLTSSLQCCSAKIWICEDAFDFTPKWNEEILVSTWCQHAVEAFEAFANNRLPSPPEQEKAIWGIQAPTGTVLEVKGAFLDPDGNEVVPKSKVHRRFEIQKYGWS